MTKNIGNKKHSSRMRTNYFSTTSTRCQHQWVAGTRGRDPVQWGPMPGGDARTRAGESVYSKAENITFLQLRWRVAKMKPVKSFHSPPSVYAPGVEWNTISVFIHPRGVLRPFYEPPLVVANPTLYLWWIIGIAILNRISHMVTDEFLQTTLLLKPLIFTDNLCSL